MATKKKNKSKQSQDDLEHETLVQSEILELKHARHVICSRLSRFCDYLDNDQGDVFQIEIRLKSVEDDFSEFDRIQTRLEFFDIEESSTRLETESRFYLVISRAKKLISDNNKNEKLLSSVNSSRQVQSISLQSSAVAKLPDLGLPSFYGNFEGWFSFIDIFNSLVHVRSDLTDIDKFLYLRICCKSDALKLIESLEIVSENYSVALSILQKRYENKRAVINYHINNLLFKLPNATKESSVQTRKLLDIINQHLLALEKLSMPVQHWDALLIPLILQKIDDRTVREWEGRQTNNVLPSLNELIEFLTKKCFALEATNHDSRKHDRENTGNRHEKYSKFNSSVPANKQLTYALTNQQTHEFIKCIFCKNDNHFIYQCPQFIQLPLNEKYEIIRKNKICSNCLRPGHYKSECRSRGCKKCNAKHNSVLHVNSPTNTGGSASSGNVENQSQGNLVHCSSRLHRAIPAPIDRDFVAEEAGACSRAVADVSVLNNTDGNCLGNRGKHTAHSMVALDQSKRGESKLNVESFCHDTSQDICERNIIYANSKIYANRNINDKKEVLLPTATILVSDSGGNWSKCSVLLDSGSNSNLISQSLCNKLKLKLEKINNTVTGVNKVATNISNLAKARIKSRFNDFTLELTFLVLPVLTEKLPLSEFDTAELNIPTDLNMADERFNIPKEIDMLLGSGIFYDLLGTNKISLGINKPILFETVFGWIVAGNFNFKNYELNRFSCNYLTKISNRDLHDSLNKFWQLEEFENKRYFTKIEEYCENYFKNTTKRDQDGTFIVKYPFKQDCKFKLGDSKKNALTRLNHLERRFVKNPDLKQQYLDFMNEYQALEHMRFKCLLDEDTSIQETSFFLPHSAVLRDSETTKCRVVFDASAKSSSGISLNDLILVGPQMQDQLYSILLRMRLKRYVLCADIKMMFRCVLIDESERPYQQILWRKNTDEPIKVYYLNTVTYGTSSAPYQATRCLYELSNLNQQKFPLASSIIKNSFYMDDLLISVDSESEALQVYDELSSVLSEANFYLRKWSSNNKIILQNIIRKNNFQNVDKLVIDDKKELKPLGLIWDPNYDTIKYKINVSFNRNKVTKRTVLSAISQIYDPLGLIGPAIVLAKIFIQHLWKLKIGWDEELSNELKETWLVFMSQIQDLNEISIDRQVLKDTPVSIEFIGFGDSSEKAYGACIYICSIDATGNRVVKLLTAKSRVAPVKKQTLPRLELLAAHLLAELMERSRNVLGLHPNKVVYFTDSTIVLSWLKVEPSKLKTFVANRISKILEVSKVSDWKFIRSSENAADIISRGVNPAELIQNDMWFHGPEFLKKNFIPDYDVDTLNVDELPETKKACVVLNVINSNEFQFQANLFDRFSNLGRLLRVVSYIRRFKAKPKERVEFSSVIITPQELIESLDVVIKLAQAATFKDDIKYLEIFQKPSKSSKILNLNPFLDSRGILRVGGRLGNSEVSYEQRHPIILPYKHKLTNLIILDLHRKHLHVGIQNLLSIIRLQFWPINGKNSVKQVVKNCIRCFKVNPKSSKFLMGSLPSPRVTPSRPFSNCGIDYAGPIYVKEGTLRKSKLIKAYICVFVCFATKAAHLELVSDLTTHSFLNCLKRFCSRRGKPKHIYSDNGLNFVGADNYFHELYDLLNSKEHNETVASFLARDLISWHFIPARAAHMGGLWEAMVKSVKFHLRRVLQNSSLTFEETYTVLVQIEACLNSRPLVPISNDINDFNPLTPAHFLIGDSLLSQPEEEVRNIKISRLSRYQHLVHLIQQFWSRWSREYLSNLQTRGTWKSDEGPVVKVGSLVVIVEDNVPPLKWTMARVTELHPGADNVVRVISVQLPNRNIVRRSLTKICPLPLDSEEDSENKQ